MNLATHFDRKSGGGNALRRVIGAAIVLASVFLISSVLNWSSSTRALRERAYPIPDIQCAKDHICDQKALAISTREAITADAALDVAFVQLALSVAGIFGVGATLYYAHRAWEEAKRSADAATRSLEDTRDATRRQLRAYISAIEFRLEDFSPNKNPRSIWKLKNFGVTPAFDVVVTACTFVTDPSEGKIFFPHKPTNRRDVHPGEEYEIPYVWPFSMNAEYASGFQNNTKCFIYAGIIKYRDAFGRRRFTTFKKKAALQALKGGGGEGPMINCMRGNRSN